MTPSNTDIQYRSRVTSLFLARFPWATCVSHSTARGSCQTCTWVPAVLHAHRQNRTRAQTESYARAHRIVRARRQNRTHAQTESYARCKPHARRGTRTRAANDPYIYVHLISPLPRLDEELRFVSRAKPWASNTVKTGRRDDLPTSSNPVSWPNSHTRISTVSRWQHVCHSSSK